MKFPAKMITLPLLAILLLFSMLQPGYSAPTGNADAGKNAWNRKFCKNCHGNQGEGAYGPDLAGRGISYEEFQRAVRKPWGVMPAFTDRQMPDQMLADFYAYFSSMPRVSEPGPWTVPAPPDAPRGQVLLIANGCAQCHNAELRNPRMVLGGEAADVDLEYFSKRIYEHTEFYPEGLMGNFSKMRLPESILQEIYRFTITDLGLMPNIAAAIPPGVPAGSNTTYTLTMKNDGVKGKGLTAEDLTISLNLPPGASVVGSAGAGYQGLRKDPKTNADIAVWQVASIVPGDAQTYTLTLSGTTGAPADVFKGSMVRWTKPEIRKGAPNLALRDPRLLSKDPQTPVAFPAAPPAQR